jgi:transcriptional regulator with XRE-family HTH domain
MGQEVRGVPEDLEVADDPQGSIGRYLASQRRLRDISLDQLAALTKLPRRSLERLESGAFDQEPDGFARGFVRTVAIALGLDPDEAVMRLMREPPDDEAEERRRTVQARWELLGRAALLVVALVAGLGLWRLGAVWLAPSPERPASEVILRRDPIRSLADAEAAGNPQALRAGPAPAGAEAGGAQQAP